MIVRSLAFVVMLTFGFSAPVYAGAWPREDGTAFLAGHVRQDTDNTDDKPVISLYGEYGLTPQWVVAAKLEYDLQEEEVAYAKLAGRWHFPDAAGALRKALSFGMEGSKDEQFLTPAIYFGRGFETRLGAGWFDVELNAKLSTETWDAEYGAFALVGLKPHRKIMTMMGLDVKSGRDQRQVNVIPSLAWQYTPGRHVHLEWTHALAGDNIDEVAAGLWLEF
ncbi:hypothetical protein [Aliiroseovarius sp. 2305UL8-7]|uniref:hypothetical protein n=1 Tax=Aliiroseovarius conchicola TaxID=3121637 RepID=UPI003527686D